MAAATRTLEELLERFEWVNGRPLVAASPPGCSCRGVPDPDQPDLPRCDELALEPAMAGR
jgi:hypothetical protein